MKLCLSCSSGGHLTQMLQLEDLFRQHEYFFITEENSISQQLASKHRIHFVPLINRRMLTFPFLFLKNVISTMLVLRKEKPDLLISTGVLAAVPSILVAKLAGIPVIYIESFAKIKSPTLTGKLVYPFVDLFVVQWEDMLPFYPKAVYGGKIY